MTNRDEIRKLCEKLGPVRVKEFLSESSFSSGLGFSSDRFQLIGHEHIVKVWLEENEARKNETIKQEELSIAKEANKIAKEAKDKAIMANYIALGTLVFVLLNFIYELFFKK